MTSSEIAPILLWALGVYTVLALLVAGVALLSRSIFRRVKYSPRGLKRSLHKAQMAEKNIGRQIWNALQETHRFSIDSRSYARPMNPSGYSLLVYRKVDGWNFRKDSVYIQVRYESRKEFTIRYSIGDRKSKQVSAAQVDEVIRETQNFLNLASD